MVKTLLKYYYWILGIIMTVALVIFLAYIFSGPGTDVPPQVLTAQSVATGTWVHHKTEELDQSSFYCAGTGAYAGHVVHTSGDWWNTYISDDMRGSFIDEASAKRHIEEMAQKKEYCK